MAKKLIQVVYTVNDKALIQSAATLRANEAAANKADTAVKKYGTDAEKAGNQASKSFLNLGNIWKGLIGIGIVAMFTNLAKKAVDLGIKQEQLNIAFTTFLGSAEKARKLLEQLNKFALVTPFTPDQVNKAAQSLLAFGVEGSKIIPTLKILGDVSSGTGKDLGEMAIIFGQIRSTGRLMGQDLLQLINAGFNPLQIISEKTGQSVKILKQEMEKGNITFDMVEQAFIDATSAGGLFFDLMEKQSRTIGGVLSTIEGNFDEFLKNIFTAQSGPAKRFVDLLERLSRGLLLFSLTEEQVANKGNEIIKDDFKVKFQEFAKGFTDLDEAAKVMNESLAATIALLDQEHRQLLISETATEEETNAKLREIEVKKQQIAAIRELLDAREEEKKAADTKDLQKRLEEEAKAAAAHAKIIKNLASILKRNLEDPAEEPFLIEDNFWENTLLRLEEFGDSLTEEMNRQADEELQIQHDKNLAEIDEEKRKQDEIKRLREQAFDFGVELLGQFLMASIATNDEIFQREKGNFEQRLNAAGNNERARQEIREEQIKFEQEQDAKEQEAARSQAQREKEIQIKQMIIAGLLNSIKAAGQGFPIPNFKNAALTALFTAAQVGVAKGVGFREGGYTGEGNLDEVAGVVHKREFVVRAENVPGSRQLLEAVQDRTIDDRILHKLNPAQSGGSRGVDLSGIEKRLDALKQPDHYERGMFVIKVEKKRDGLRRHTKAKYGL